MNGSVSVSLLRRAVGALLLFGVMFALTGCTTPKPKGSVKGTVKVKGEPLTSGTINFHSDKGIAADAKLDSSGNYSIENLEVGEYKVYFLPPPPQQLPPDSKEKPAKVTFNVPPKYQQHATTTLTFEVKAGPNEKSFEVTD